MKIDMRYGMLAIWTVSLAIVSGQEIYFPKRELASESVGLLITSIRNAQFTGSGTVAHDPRLIFSCAHVLYEQGRWAKNYTFHRAWHGRRAPVGGGMSPRGFLADLSYANEVEDHGMASNFAYLKDMSVFYRSRPFGIAVPVLKDSSEALLSRRSKRIIGYPRRLDFTGAKGYYYQHTTDWFRTGAVRRHHSYLLFNDVTTGPGNSGGGVFLKDVDTGESQLAGIVVSGNDYRAGILAMDYYSESLAVEALFAIPKRRVAANPNSIPLRESTSVTRILRMEDGNGRIETAELDVEFKDVSGNAPLIHLQSPAGRIHRIAMAANQSSIRRLNLGRALYGSKSGGDWLLRIRSDKQSTAVFERAALHLTEKCLN